MTKKSLFLSIIMIFMFILNVFSHNPEDFRIDSFKTGSLGSGEEIWYKITTFRPGNIIIETTGSLDTFLEVYDEQMNLITRDDDSGEGLNAAVNLFTAGNTALLVKLGGYFLRGDRRGDYWIFLSQKPTPSPITLNTGSFLDGNIIQGEDYWYSVRADVSGFIVIETTGNTDTYMEAYTSAFMLITSDDDSGEDLNAKLKIPVLAGGTYLIRVKGFCASRTSGTYRIHAGRINE
ncbi:MAG: hypothetical protein FWD14_05975 [Treponema sp.]|nr:hypothetical protein [Treponema sp.]